MIRKRYDLGDPYVQMMIGRIFQTAEGKVLADVLRGVIETVHGPGIEASALHDFQGARRLASNLIQCQPQETIDSDDASPRSANPSPITGSGSRRRGPARAFANSSPGSE